MCRFSISRRGNRRETRRPGWASDWVRTVDFRVQGRGGVSVETEAAALGRRDRIRVRSWQETRSGAGVRVAVQGVLGLPQ